MAQKMVTYFKDFLREIRLTENQVNELKNAHTTLRNRLSEDEELSKIVETTFLQGSYRRSTAVRPKNGKRSDVDIVVVTKMDKDEVEPETALDVFEPFLKKHYDGKYRKQGRSWGIEMSHVDLDIVQTASTSLAESGILENSILSSNDEIEEMDNKATMFAEKYTNDMWYRDYMVFFSASKDEWKEEPLYIPDWKAELWDKTHPLEQIRWTQDKNKKCNGHYVNVVKCIKWWRKEKFSDVEKPKSYPLEHFIGDCCPDGISSVAEGITLTLEAIVNDYPDKPFLADRGVPEHDVFAKVTEEEYTAFYESVCEAAVIARNAYDAKTVEDASAEWRKLFGNKFPEPPKKACAAFTKRESGSGNISGGRFA